MGKWTDLPKKPKNSKISTPPYQAKEGEGGGGGGGGALTLRWCYSDIF